MRSPTPKLTAIEIERFFEPLIAQVRAELEKLELAIGKRAILAAVGDSE